VAFILQAPQAHYVTIDGGKYNVPSGEITLDESIFGFPQNLTSYALEAVSGADDFNDDNTAIDEGMLNSLVNNTRDVAPTCEFSLFACVYWFPNQVRMLWGLG
jgi:hypothetical protein